MHFDFPDEQRVLRDQARKFLSERAAPGRVDKDAPFEDLPTGRRYP